MQAYTKISSRAGASSRWSATGKARDRRIWVEHGRFTVAGQQMVAMDSHIEHGFSFNEALSLQVMCEDQDEVDLDYWDALSEGGEKGPCGWVKDCFGVSWQVVPDAMNKWMESPDVPARDRAFAAMMGMGKLDIATLQAAFDGE